MPFVRTPGYLMIVPQKTNEQDLKGLFWQILLLGGGDKRFCRDMS